MDELEFRRRLFATPKELSEDDKAFAKQSPERQALMDDINALDNALGDAMKVPVPDDLADRLVLNQVFNANRKVNRFRKFHLGLAASIAFVFGVLVTYSQQSVMNLEQHTLAHLYHELGAHRITEDSLNLTQVNAQMSALGGELIALPERVMKAAICNFKGQVSLHVVLATEQGPITAFIVPASNEHDTLSQFSDNRFKGEIAQSRHANVIVIGEKGAELNTLTQALEQNLSWRI